MIRHLLKAVLLFTGLLSSCLLWSNTLDNLKTSTPNKKPNVLFIAVDDLNVFNTTMGNSPDSFLQKVYPDNNLRQSVIKRLTPNLDRLAQQSLVFERAYTASPLCGPSRTALMTGVAPHVSGYYQHDKHFRFYETLKNTITLPQYLKANGYYTAGAGKVFHKGRTEKRDGIMHEWADQSYSWSDWIEVHAGTNGQTLPGIKKQLSISKYWDPINPGFTKFGSHNIPFKNSNDYLNSEYAAQMVLNGHATLKNTKGKLVTTTIPDGQPWFVAVGIFAPHMPWVVEQSFFDMFPQSEMSIDRNLLDWMKNDLKDVSQTSQKLTANTRISEMMEYSLKIEPKTGDINSWKAIFQAYLASTAFADRSIGVLLNAIENNPEKDNTIVVLWSDHGYHVGDKNRKGKATLWEASTHSNLIILDPRYPNANKGLRTQSAVSLQDIYPTIVSLTGLKRPEHIYGYDLTPLLIEPNQDWNKAVLSTYDEGNHTIRLGDFRYLRFKNGEQELYNLATDPLEENNLANNRMYNSKILELSRVLDKRLSLKPKHF